MTVSHSDVFLFEQLYKYPAGVWEPYKGQGSDIACIIRFGEMSQWEQRQMKELLFPLMLQLKLRAMANVHGAV